MVTILKATKENIEKTAELLKAGEIMAIPTETVYGLAGDATNDQAVTKIFAIKNRPNFNPLISHYSSFEKISRDVIIDERSKKLANKFCPGPLTFVLPKTIDSRISLLASAGLNTAAVRIPAHPIAQAILNQIDRPIVAPSANLSSTLSPVNAKHVEQNLGNRINWIIDGGDSEIGLESTVIDLSTSEAKILRYGKISPEEIKSVIGKVLLPEDEISEIKAPGMLLKHYSPTTPLRLNPMKANINEALLAFGDKIIEGDFAFTKNLSPGANLNEAAANLFKYLHELDQMGFSSIAAMTVPNESLGLAINDRLRRAEYKE